MLDWLENAAGPDYAPALLWTLIALIALFVVLLVVRVIRNMTYGTFVAGGRNRKNRLAVMDATPIDGHRRLVLVRRDDVEHLILIGGSADVVVERDIRISAQARRPQPEQQVPVQGVLPPQRPQAAEQQTPRTPPPTRLPAAAPTPAAAPAEQSPNVQRTVALSRPQPIPPVANSNVDDLDEALMKELEVSLDDPDAAVQTGDTRPAQISLDEEMTKLLGELSSHKR